MLVLLLQIHQATSGAQQRATQSFFNNLSPQVTPSMGETIFVLVLVFLLIGIIWGISNNRKKEGK